MGENTVKIEIKIICFTIKPLNNRSRQHHYDGRHCLRNRSRRTRKRIGNEEKK
jgi:hypothetical protein